MLSSINKMIKNNEKFSLFLRIFGILIAIYGIIVSFEMNIGSKLFMRSTFTYWNFQEFPLKFFINYLAIMGLYICITHCTLKLIYKKSLS